MVKKPPSREKKRELIIAGFRGECFQTKPNSWRCGPCGIDFNAGNLAHITRHLKSSAHKIQSNLKSEMRTLSAQLKRAENRNEKQQELMKGAVEATLANTEVLLSRQHAISLTAVK